MSIGHLISPAIESLLTEVKQFIRPPKERTLFSLGGRGHYENPASDLLAFFMAPEAEHGFKTLFLEAFLGCMKGNVTGLDLAHVSISREVQTQEGKRIDLVVQGPDWVLLIENKIHHGQVNPFDCYHACGRSLAGERRLLLAILSPAGASVDPRWNPVSYEDFCVALRLRLGEALFNNAYSKWAVFAREFILHFENELYAPAMTNAEAQFVENHAKEITQVSAMAREYRIFLMERLKTSLEAHLPGHTITVKDDTWAVRCYSSQWGRSHLAFWVTDRETGSHFNVTVYLVGLDVAKEAQARHAMQGMKDWREGSWLAFQTQPEFESRDEAITGLCRLADIVSAIFPAVQEASATQALKH